MSRFSGAVITECMSSRPVRLVCCIAITGLIGSGGAAQDQQQARFTILDRPTLTFMGDVGLIDMPSADSMADADVTATAMYANNILRTVIQFQVTPRISGIFRYAVLNDFLPDSGTLYDRSFDIRYRFLDETRHRPAFAIGLRDFGGTGVYGSEYIVATKGVGDRLRVSVGIGWGRLGSYGGFSNPLGILADGFKTRATSGNNAGELDFGEWFRGDAAFFGGIEWRATDRFTFKFEYSSDAYEREADPMGFTHKSPFNAAVSYRFDNGIDLSAAYLYGSEIGVMLNYTFNPKTPRIPDGIDDGGPSVVPRDVAAARSWGLDLSDDGASPASRASMQARLAQQLEAEGVILKSFRIEGSRVIVHIRNDRYDAPTQAIGRTARALTSVLPRQVETFVIVPIVASMPVSAITIQRSDLEELAFDLDGSWKSYARADIAEGSPYRLRREDYVPGAYPDMRARFGGYLVPSFFDPDSPIRIEVGAELAAAYTPRPGIVFSGALRQPIAGNLDDATRTSNSVLPHVRTDIVEYEKESELEVSYLTGEYFFRPGDNLYGRVSVGMLERMYGGISAEVLWKPVEGPLALGGEFNYVRQRDYDVLFDFRDYEVATGHLSAYYDFSNGFLGQVDAGRYLAGDWGATFSLDREFANGVKIGGFFTLTDVSFDDFGEGSFDKGFRFIVPLSWLTGEPSQRGFGQTIRPVLRDGGARLSVRNRLYEITRRLHDPELKERWGRFWR